MLNVTANLNNALTALAGGMSHHTVDYRIYGQVHLQRRPGAHSIRAIDQKGTACGCRPAE